MIKYFYLFLALLFASTGIYSNIKNVPAQYSTIQSAINASVNGDTVLVAPGTYLENINFRGKKIVLTSQYYQTLNPATIMATVIDGNSPVNPDSASCVIFCSGEDSTTVLQGFAITRGSGTKWNDEHGAGVYREGGGILVALASPVIQNNIIYNNACSNMAGVLSTGGGGLRIGDCYIRLYNNVIMNNTARYGGGVVLNYTGAELKNNVICANYGSFQFGAGTGIWINGVFSRQITVTNNTISGNSSTTGICGIYGSGTAAFKNNIVWGNTSPSNVQVSGALNMTYSDIQGGYPGSGNLNIDPLFADSNYVLLVSSPCVDKGDSSTQYNDLPDPNNGALAKYPSRGALRNDMGAYGGPLARLLSNQLIGIPNIGSQAPVDYSLYQNYPNPFNPNTNITFDLPVGNFTSLKVFDILGREVSVLVNEFKQQGRYTVSFDASQLSSGIYFYTLQAGNMVITKKMILNK